MLFLEVDDIVPGRSIRATRLVHFNAIAQEGEPQFGRTVPHFHTHFCLSSKQHNEQLVCFAISSEILAHKPICGEQNTILPDDL